MEMRVTKFQLLCLGWLLAWRLDYGYLFICRVPLVHSFNEGVLSNTANGYIKYGGDEAIHEERKPRRLKSEGLRIPTPQRCFGRLG